MDPVYPNDGDQMGVFQPPVPDERKAHELKANVRKDRLARSYPVLDDLIDWFDGQIKAIDSIGNIETTALTVNGTKYESKVSIPAQVLAYQLLKSKLEEVKTGFKDFKEEHDSKV